MALTMTRNRTQTTLTKLSEAVANCHGELAFVEGLLDELAQRLSAEVLRRGETADAEAKADEMMRATLERRRVELHAARGALYLTVMQFDPQLDPTDIGQAEGWLKPFGRGGGAAARRRYLASRGCPGARHSSPD